MSETAPLADELQHTIRGRVLRREDPGYPEAVAGHNLSAVRRPAVVVRPYDADDIVSVVRAAAAHFVRVDVLATGHGAVPRADAGVLIVTAHLARVTIDAENRTARVRAGTVWRDVAIAAGEFGLAPLSGSHGSVGVVGDILGGGIGPFARQFGFAADHVTSISLVTPAGHLVTVDETHLSDLFWALRGGQHGFGVVTEVTIRLIPIPEVFGGSIFFAGASARDVLEAYARWTATVPRNVTTALTLLRVPDTPEFLPPLRGGISVQIELAHTGDAAETERVARIIRGWGAVLLDDLRRRPVSELLAAAPPRYTWGGSTLLSSLPIEAIERLLNTVGPHRDAPFSAVQLRHLGGAVRAHPRVANAVSGRDGEFLLHLESVPVPLLINGPVPAIAKHLFNVLAPWAALGQQVNFATHLSVDEQSAAWAPNVDADLEAIRRQWDPNGLFRPQTPPANRPSTP